LERSGGGPPGRRSSHGAPMAVTMPALADAPLLPVASNHTRISGRVPRRSPQRRRSLGA
jgi:hypothetical protein